MKSKTFNCPSCNNPLQLQHAPAKSPKNPEPFFVIWCGNSRCPSDATNDGGTGETEEAAYRSLLLAVKHEEDKATEAECEPLTPEDKKDRDGWAVAEHKNDMEKAGGA